MSRKNTTTSAQTAEQPTAQEPETVEQTTKETAGEVVKLVYIGPSIAFSKLHSSTILNGTEAEIKEYLSDMIESYPEIEHLLVSPEDLTDALDKVARKGTILHKYYEDTLAKARASRT